MDYSSVTARFVVLGGDLRQIYLANYISKQGYSVSCYLTPLSSALLPAIRQPVSLQQAVSENSVIVGPVPFSRDGNTLTGIHPEAILLSALFPLLKKDHILTGGNLPSSVLSFCTEKEIPCYDLMSSESLAYHNAEITAEGMLCEILKNTPFVLQNCRILVIGFGKCGSILVHKLHALHAKVSICELAEQRRELASSFGFPAFSPIYLKEFLPRFSLIINTVPSPVLKKETFSNLSPDCFLFDLSSPPGGIDLEAAKENHIPTFHCLGLPGKIAPLSAGEAIGKILIERIATYDRLQ